MATDSTARPESVLQGWHPIETAPRDVPILVWYDHKADPYRDPDRPEMLTAYAAHAESGDFMDGAGLCIARWSEGWHENDGWEAGDSYWMPDAWFPWFDGEYSERVVNPVLWLPLPPAPTMLGGA